MVVEDRRVRQLGGAERRPHRWVLAFRRGPPVTMATSVRGTSSDSATCTMRKPTMTDMPRKWIRRAVWKPPRKRDQPGELDRLPDRQPGHDLRDAGQDDDDVEDLLHRVVDGQVFVGDLEADRLAHGLDDLGHADRQQPLPEAAGDEAVDQVSEAVDREHPHGGEVPEQALGGPAAEPDRVREVQEAEDDAVVVDAPAGADHDQHGDGVRPVHDPHRQRMQALDGRIGVGRWSRSWRTFRDSAAAGYTRGSLGRDAFLLWSSVITICDAVRLRFGDASAWRSRMMRRICLLVLLAFAAPAMAHPAAAAAADGPAGAGGEAVSAAGAGGRSDRAAGAGAVGKPGRAWPGRGDHAAPGWRARSRSCGSAAFSGLGRRPIAVPIEAMALLGPYVVAVDYSKKQLAVLPTATETGAALGADEMIRVGVVRPFH